MGEKLAVFVPTLEVGGAERVTVNLARGFADRGYDVDLVLARGGGPLAEEVPSDVTVVDLDIVSVPGAEILGSLPGLVRYLRVECPDAMISSMIHANVAAVLAWRLAGVPTHLTVVHHNTPTSVLEESFNPRTNRAAHFAAERLYPMADAIVAVSHGVKDDLVETLDLRPDDVTVVYNPIATPEVLAESFDPPDHPWFGPDEPPVVIGAGRMVPQKDFQTLIEAFATVRERRNARLLIFGEGDQWEQLERRIAHLGLEDDAVLHEPVDNPTLHQFMQHAGAFALSSRFEGLPTVLIEALICGCPIVSTDCPSGPAEILADGEYGTLVPVGDPDRLAEGIASTLDDPTPAEDLRERARLFSLDTAIDRYERVLGWADGTPGDRRVSPGVKQ